MGNDRRAEPVPSTSRGLGSERSPSPSFIDNDLHEGHQLFPSSQRLGNVVEREEAEVSFRMAQENSEPNDDVSVERVPQLGIKYYHTIILKNYAKVPTSISCLYVELDNHMHVLFQARDNVNRKIDCFDNLLNRTVALMEEPRITMTTKNDFKNLLGGDEFEIDVKYGAKRAALYSRVKEYNLREQITSELIKGTIPKAPVTLCTCHLRDLFKRYGFYGDNVVEIDIPVNAEIIYQTPKRTTSDEYDIEEDGFLIRLPPKI
ncbi:unnamed protein product [Rodentolepis nana]|uniref:Arrestin_C domain-containing protein n=1 Tax=Rodentolepis nana TaxID=102285 RepID=A0A0R3TQ82_RODNA|nr:unnamed protein product [Rodentolepis nana]